MRETTVRDAAVAHVTAMIDELTPKQQEDLVAGRGRLVFRPDSPRQPRPILAGIAQASVDVGVAVGEINRMTSPADVAGYLEGQRFSVAALREIARALGPTVLSTGRSKDELTRNIIEGTAGFRTRAAAMSGGAWA